MIFYWQWLRKYVHLIDIKSMILDYQMINYINYILATTFILNWSHLYKTKTLPFWLSTIKINLYFNNESVIKICYKMGQNYTKSNFLKSLLDHKKMLYLMSILCNTPVSKNFHFFFKRSKTNFFICHQSKIIVLTIMFYIMLD